MDVIDRQAAIDALDVLCQEHRYKIPGKQETYSQYNEAWQDALDRAENAIGNLPSAEPERKTGRWLELTNTNHTYVCSVCGRMLVNITDGKNMVSKKYPFCHCGAKMEVEDEEEV